MTSLQWLQLSQCGTGTFPAGDPCYVVSVVQGHQTEGSPLDPTWKRVELSLFTMVQSSLFSQFTSLKSILVAALEHLSKEKWLCW